MRTEADCGNLHCVVCSWCWYGVRQTNLPTWWDHNWNSKKHAVIVWTLINVKSIEDYSTVFWKDLNHSKKVSNNQHRGTISIKTAVLTSSISVTKLPFFGDILWWQATSIDRTLQWSSNWPAPTLKRFFSLIMQLQMIIFPPTTCTCEWRNWQLLYPLRTRRYSAHIRFRIFRFRCQHCKVAYVLATIENPQLSPS